MEHSRLSKLGAAGVLGLALAVSGIAHAAPIMGGAASPDAAPAKASPASDLLSTTDIQQFVRTYGTPVVQVSTPLRAAPLDSAPPTARLRALERLVVTAGATWSKEYRVTPAGVGAPVTTFADAADMVDQQGLVNLGGTSMPADSAIRTVARADGATAVFPDGAPRGTVVVDFANASIPQAIASLAARTHTHWQAVYVVGPISSSTPTPNKVAFPARSSMTQQQYEATQLFNGPVNIRVPLAAPQAMTTTAGPAQTTTPAQTPATTTGGAPTNPAQTATPPYAYPYGSPYAYYGASGYNPYAYGAYGYTPYSAYGYSPYGGYGYNPYGGYGMPYQAAPGLVTIPGSPYYGNMFVFGGG